jgi:hypothetical protein
VAPDAFVRVGEQGSPGFAGQCVCRTSLGLAGEDICPDVNRLVEFTIKSMEQQDASGLVKIDQ